MSFDEIIGNDHIKKFFQKTLEEKKIANSLLFSGIDGIGKFLFAKNLAKSLMYDNIDEHEVKKIETETHPDFHVYRPEGKAAIHSVSSIRSLISKVSSHPFEAKASVFVIDEAHRMLDSGYNALLKTLEEPTLHSYIILLTDSEKELLPTIISRCFRVKFSPLSDTDLISLIKRWGKTHAEAKRIALFSMGSVSRAIKIASYVENEDLTEIILNILSRTSSKNYFDFSNELNNLQKIFDIEKEKSFSYKSLDVLFSHIIMWYRDLHLLKNRAKIEHLFFSDKIDLLEKQTSDTLVSLNKVMDLIDNAKESIKRNIKLKYTLENLFFSLGFF